MSITFQAEVGKTRVLGDYQVTNVKVEAGKYPQYIDLKFPADDAPALNEGDTVSVTFAYLPQARGWESNRQDQSGKPYINANLVLWKPKVEGASASHSAPKPAPDDDDIPF